MADLPVMEPVTLHWSLVAKPYAIAIWVEDVRRKPLPAPSIEAHIPHPFVESP